MLEHESAVRPRTCDDAAVDEDLARRQADQTVHRVEERGLAAAARADDGDELALAHVEVDAAQHLELLPGPLIGSA